MAGYVFAVVACFVMPIGACIIAVKKKMTRTVVLGSLCFLVFQVFTRLPVIQYVLPQFAAFSVFQISHPILYILLLAVSAGVFEECGRYIIMKALMKNTELVQSIVFGAAHGGTEAILLVGINSIMMLAMGTGQVSGAQMFIAGLERLFAISGHICWSVIVWRSIKVKKVALLASAVLLHTAFDFAAGYLSYIGSSVFVVETVVAIMSGLLVIYVVLTGKRLYSGGKML